MHGIVDLAMLFQSSKANILDAIIGTFTEYPYLSHILVGVFPPFWLPNLIFGGTFWLPNLIFGGIPKDTKKPTNSQYFVYELVG